MKIPINSSRFSGKPQNPAESCQPKLYLETSLFNFYYARKNSQKKEDTHRLFEAVRQGKYKAYTSEYVVGELRKASPGKYKMMKKLLDECIQNVLPYNKKAEDLAEIYITNGIIPVK